MGYNIDPDNRNRLKNETDNMIKTLTMEKKFSIASVKATIEKLEKESLRDLVMFYLVSLEFQDQGFKEVLKNKINGE